MRFRTGIIAGFGRLRQRRITFYDKSVRLGFLGLVALLAAGLSACGPVVRETSEAGAVASLPGAVTDIQVLAGPPARLLVTVDRGAGVYWSDDGGAAWHPARKMGDLAAFRLLPLAEPDVVLVATSRGVYRSADRGVTWALAWGTRLGAFALHLADGDRPVAGGHETIARADPAGQRWETARGRLPNATVLALTAPAGAGEALFAGTNAAGVWATRDAGRTWQPVYPTRAVVSHLAGGSDSIYGVAGPALLHWSGDVDRPRVLLPPNGGGRPLSLATEGAVAFVGTEGGAVLSFDGGWRELDRFPAPVTALRVVAGQLCAGSAAGEVRCRLLDSGSAR